MRKQNKGKVSQSSRHIKSSSLDDLLNLTESHIKEQGTIQEVYPSQHMSPAHDEFRVTIPFISLVKYLES